MKISELIKSLVTDLAQYGDAELYIREAQSAYELPTLVNYNPSFKYEQNVVWSRPHQRNISKEMIVIRHD